MKERAFIGWGSPSPVRVDTLATVAMHRLDLAMSRRQLVVGRIDGEERSIGVVADALEVPTADALVLRGWLWGEAPGVSDATVASLMAERGFPLEMPLFYEYVDAVWLDIAYCVERKCQGRLRACSCCSELRTAISFSAPGELEERRRFGADEWLLVAVFRIRMKSIASDYISFSY